MTITIRAVWRLLFLCLCFFGMSLNVLILAPSAINAAENRAGIVTINRDSASLQQRSAQPQAEIDQATSLNRQARQYLDQGKYDEAEPLLKRALAIRERALGPAHPDTATSLNNLAELYRIQGKYGAAEPLYQRSLAIRVKALGASHPDTASSLNNLALHYDSQGKYAEAEPLYKRSLAICEKTLGPDHPHTATSLNNLAA